MKAVEFIRKFGRDNSKECLKGIRDSDSHFVGICGEFTNWRELNRYVEAYELVESYGGLSYVNFALIHGDLMRTDELDEAITLVEEI